MSTLDEQGYYFSAHKRNHRSLKDGLRLRCKIAVGWILKLQKNDGLNIRACVQRGTLKLNRALLLFRDRLLHESSGLRGVQHQNCSRQKKPAVKQKGPPLGRRDDSVAFRHFLGVRAALFSANLVWSWPWMKRLALNSNSLFNQPAHKQFPQNQCCPCNSGGGGGGELHYAQPLRVTHSVMCSGSRGDASLPSTLTSMRYNATCFTICVQKTLKARITRHKMGDCSRNGGEKNAPPRANLAPGTRLMVFYVSEHSWTFGENTLKRRQTT